MLYSEFDDLKPLANDPERVDPTLTLLCIVRNEMYFIPQFLRHYRSLGVTRFVAIDDCSDDGTREYLCRQPDVVVLESSFRYGTLLNVPGDNEKVRACVVWRSLLAAKFASDRWALQVDIDELLQLPAGWSLRDLVRFADRQKDHALVGAMLDIYPRTVADLKSEEVFDPAGEWYFDAVPHLVFDKPGMPAQVYNGSRSRFFAQYDLAPIGRRQTIRNFFGATKYRRTNQLSKVFMLRWCDGARIVGAHETTLPVCQDILVPLLHFKFTSDLYRRTRYALESGGYYNASSEYHLMQNFLAQSDGGNGRLTCRYSKLVGQPDVFAQSGNMLLQGVFQKGLREIQAINANTGISHSGQKQPHRHAEPDTGRYAQGF